MTRALLAARALAEGGGLSFFSFARTLTWELTKGCGRSCAHCVSALYHGAVPDELAPEAALAVVDRCAEARIGRVHLLGGEPTTRSDLPALLERLEARGVRASMTTNGIALAEGPARVLGRPGPLRAIYVSFEDIREAEADAIRGQGAFSAACEGVRRLRREAPELRVTVAFTVNRPALEALDPREILAFFGRLGAERVLFQELAVPPEAPPRLSRLALDGPLWLGFLERLFAVEGEEGVVPFEAPLKPLVAEHLSGRLGRPVGRGGYACRAGDRELRLLPNGTLLACSAAVGWPAALAAAIAAAPPLPEVSFDEALEAAHHRRFAAVREARGADPVMEPCRGCRFAFVECTPCPYGRLVGEERRVQSCAWVAALSSPTGTRRRPWTDDPT